MLGTFLEKLFSRKYSQDGRMHGGKKNQITRDEECITNRMGVYSYTTKKCALIWSDWNKLDPDSSYVRPP